MAHKLTLTLTPDQVDIIQTALLSHAEHFYQRALVRVAGVTDEAHAERVSGLEKRWRAVDAVEEYVKAAEWEFRNSHALVNWS